MSFKKRGLRLLLILMICSSLFLSSCRLDEESKIFDHALELWEEKKYEEAIQNFIALTKAYPNHELVDNSLFWIASIYDHYLQEPQHAIRYYRALNKSFEDSEYYVRSMSRLGKLYSERTSEKRKAILIYNKLQKLELDSPAWIENQYQMARIYLDLKQFKQARIALKKLILKYPKNEIIPQSYYLIGVSYRLEGELELAEITFLETDKKFNYSKKSLSSAISLAAVYEEMGQLHKAIRVYQLILKRLGRKDFNYELFKDRINKLNNRLKKTSN